MPTTATWTLAATHAAVHWDDPADEHLEVFRDDKGLTAVRALGTDPVPVPESATALGLSLPDYVRFYRRLLFVEGEHDRAVLEGFIGAALSSTRTWVVSLDGADGLSHLAAATPLFAATDAPIVVVLDHVSADEVRSVWSSARARLKEDGDERRALRELDPLRDGTKEERLFYRLGRAALRLGQVDRLLPFGFQQPDIIFYLDPSAFVKTSPTPTWDELDEEWKRCGDTSDFKSWLRMKKGAKVNTTFVANVARTMPEDRRRGGDEFAALVKLLEGDE